MTQMRDARHKPISPTERKEKRNLFYALLDQDWIPMYNLLGHASNVHIFDYSVGSFLRLDEASRLFLFCERANHGQKVVNG